MRRSLVISKCLFYIDFSFFGIYALNNNNCSTLYERYRRESHNILYMPKWQRHRDKIIHKGRINIVAALSKMPQTRTDMDSLMIDVQFSDVSCECGVLAPSFRTI